jgi:hypothetical protein
MSGDFPRRPFLIGLGALVGAGLVGGALYESGVFGHHLRSARGYEDLLSGLDDRDVANRLGDAVLGEAETFEAPRIAHELRKRIANRPLSVVLAEDLAEDRVVETKGWVLPETLALLCGLSAKLD